MCVYIYIFIYLYLFIHLHVHVCIYIYIYIHTYINMWIFVLRRPSTFWTGDDSSCICMRTRTHKHTQTSHEPTAEAPALRWFRGTPLNPGSRSILQGSRFLKGFFEGSTRVDIFGFPKGLPYKGYCTGYRDHDYKGHYCRSIRCWEA